MENEIIKEKVQGMLTAIVNEIDPIKVLDYLVEKHIVIIEDREQIMTEKTKSDRCRALIYHLLGCSHEEAFIVFMDAVKKYYPWIANRINAYNTREEQLKKELYETKMKLQEATRKTEQYDELEKSFVLSFTTRAAKEASKAISGIAIVKDKLFISSFQTSEIEIYGLKSLALHKILFISCLVNSYDMKYCNVNDCLYIMDQKYADSPKEILRMTLDGELIKTWTTDMGYGFLSVTFDSNVLLATYNEGRIEEYTPQGDSIQKFALSSERGFPHSRYAIKLSDDRYLISHGEEEDETHRVCIVDRSGKVFVAFGGECGSSLTQLNVPIFLEFYSTGSVIVVDRDNSRVLLLDSENLTLKRELIPKGDHGMTRPERMAYDASSGRLFVAHNDAHWEECRIFVFEQCR